MGAMWHALLIAFCCGIFSLASQAVEGTENFGNRNTVGISQTLLSAYL